MGYKKINKSFGFADFALAKSLKHNRSLKKMEKLADSMTKFVFWYKIDYLRKYSATLVHCSFLPQNDFCRRIIVQSTRFQIDYTHIC